MNRLFVVDKPMFQSSNGYMRHIKRKYNSKKVGFSGTLDPFATGCLIVAIGKYTKLFQYLKKTPKAYSATLWLGANSESLDIENITSIKETREFTIDEIYRALESLRGEISYYPPKFSAKKIDGKRAYELARENRDVNLKKITSTIYDIHLVHYNHPFIHFEVMVSEGAYIRSLGTMISDKLGVDATLSSLRRLYEGKFHYDKEKALDPLNFLKIPQNIYSGDIEYLKLGKKLSIDYFEKKDDGEYWVKGDEFFSVIEIRDGVVGYKLNRVPLYKG
ncbi:MAG: tRNA pseudouridine(55) synthase TruB [Epsilonproteobacteria bacterium]|nr:tRNA pseudouridine(55) synthase TruB [Campylobacterota bacterium]